ncbi:MAG: hypothetical protein QM831_01970 [Kofleriaceae bacterium]
MRALIVIMLVASTARADDERFAVAVNNPGGWLMENIAASGYVGVTDALAIRVNVASDRELRTSDLFSDECTHPGRIFDVGIGLEYFFVRHRHDGPFVELGGVRRSEDSTFVCTDIDDTSSISHTTRYAGYADVGWSWALPHHAFIALALGMSYGHEHGHYTDIDVDNMVEYGHGTIDHMVTSPEWSLRIGAQF